MNVDSIKQKVIFVEKRRMICEKCEHLTTFVGVKSCNECGCAIWSKTLVPSTSCPIGKWDAEKN